MIKMNKNDRIKLLEAALQVLLDETRGRNSGGMGANISLIKVKSCNDVEITKQGDNYIFRVVTPEQHTGMFTLNSILPDLPVKKEEAGQPAPTPVNQGGNKPDELRAQNSGKSVFDEMGTDVTEEQIDRPSFQMMAYVLGICEFYGFPYPKVETFTRKDADGFMDKHKTNHQRDSKDQKEYNGECRIAAVKYLKQIVGYKRI